MEIKQELEQYIFLDRNINDGWQKIFKFENGYGASVVSHKYSYGGENGLKELAVIKFTGESWELDYSTSITDDVEGYLADDDVNSLLIKIKNLNDEVNNETKLA